VTKLTSDKAELKRSGCDDPYASYQYEAQMSRDCHHFISIGKLSRNASSSDPYRLLYTNSSGQEVVHFFRIKQVYSNGYSRFSNIREVILENSHFPKFTLYPNPSNGIVGIKFDNIFTGHFNIQIFNTQGKMMVKKGVAAIRSSHVETATTESGVWWFRITDTKSQMSCVNQLLIK